MLVAALLACASCGSALSAEQLASAVRGQRSDSTVGAAAASNNAEPGAVASGQNPASAIGTSSTAPTGQDPVASADTGGSGGTTGPASGEPILVGHIGDYSSLAGSILGSAPATLQAWAQYTNAHGGIGGRPVRVVTANAGGDPAQALSLARDMVENRHVVAFVGNMQALSLTGLVDYLQQTGVPLIGGDLTSTIYTSSPVIFTQGTDVQSLVAAEIRIEVGAGRTRGAILYCAEADFVCGNAYRFSVPGGLARANGMDIVSTSQVSVAQPSFTAECIQARDAGANTLLLFMDPSSIGRIVRDCEQQNFNPSFSTLGPAVSPALEGNRQLVGLRAPLNTFPWVAGDTPAAAAFQDALRTYAPQVRTSPVDSLVWTAGEMFAEAARRAGADVSPQSLIAALGTFNGVTLGGLAPPLTFAAGQQASPLVPCYFQIVMGDDARWSAPNGSQAAC